MSRSVAVVVEVLFASVSRAPVVRDIAGDRSLLQIALPTFELIIKCQAELLSVRRNKLSVKVN